MKKNIHHPDAPPAEFKGSCHCGDITFKVTMPSPYDYAVSNCNCSLCTRWGYLNMTCALEDLEIQGEDKLQTYQWGHKRVTHKFCPTCATNLFVYYGKFSESFDGTGFGGVNVRWPLSGVLV